MQTKLCDACKATGRTPKPCSDCGGLDVVATCDQCSATGQCDGCGCGTHACGKCRGEGWRRWDGVLRWPARTVDAALERGDLQHCPGCSRWADAKLCPVCCGVGSVLLDGSPVPRVADQYRPQRVADLRRWLDQQAKAQAELAAKLAEGGLL